MKTNEIITELYQRIAAEVSPNLSYHGLHHTIDVHNTCKLFIQHYNLDKNIGSLLEIAAAGHDIGFLKTYRNHEEVSAEITAEIMLRYNYGAKDIRMVCDMIMATKIPQSPKNLLEEIICDADLDYLGRNDFEPISRGLLKEWKSYKVFPELDTTFDSIQVGFFKGHSYHTEYAQKHRTDIKAKNLQKIEARLLIAQEA